MQLYLAEETLEGPGVSEQAASQLTSSSFAGTSSGTSSPRIGAEW
jgi:hypothetical protein